MGLSLKQISPYFDKRSSEQEEIMNKHNLVVESVTFIKKRMKGHRARTHRYKGKQIIKIFRCKPCANYSKDKRGNKGDVCRLNIDDHITKQDHLDNLETYEYYQKEEEKEREIEINRVKYDKILSECCELKGYEKYDWIYLDQVDEYNNYRKIADYDRIKYVEIS